MKERKGKKKGGANRKVKGREKRGEKQKNLGYSIIANRVFWSILNTFQT